MRSVNNLFEKVWPFERLLVAYRQASKGKRRRHDVASFDANLGDRLVDLSERLASGRWRPGPYRSFLFEEHGKRRLISAAPFEDRVVHHAIVNAIEPVWERRFVGWSFANRKGKGTHAAMRHAEKGVRGFRYCLQIDIQRFFPSIDHLVLKSLLARHIRDKAMLDLISLVIDSGKGLLDKERLPSLFPGDDLLCLARPTGLPIGNQTSQFLANVYLHPLDLAISQRVRPGLAARYVDDLLLCDDSLSRLEEARELLVRSLESLRLRPHPRKTRLHSTSQGITFVGYRIEKHRTRLPRSTVTRFARKLRKVQEAFADGELELEDVRRSVFGMLGHARPARASAALAPLLARTAFVQPPIRLRSGTPQRIAGA